MVLGACEKIRKKNTGIHKIVHTTENTKKEVDTIYTVKQPKIHMSVVEGYDPATRTYKLKEDTVFDTEEELILFLAMYHIPLYNWKDEPIPGLYKNKLMESQALTGLENAGFDFIDVYYTDKEYAYINDGYRLNKYIFWLDAPGQPNIDVRKYKKEVRKILEISPEAVEAYRIERRRPKKNKKQLGYGRFPKSHTHYPPRSDARYIQRGRAASALLHDDEEYRQFVKPKDKSYVSIWKDEDMINGTRSCGWKDNSGYKFKRQWMVNEQRKFERFKEHRDIAIMSPKRVREEAC